MTVRDNPGECDCCGFITTNLQLFANQDTTIAGGGKTVKNDFWFCELCCSSSASAFHRYPGEQVSNMVVMRAICYVGNAIIKAIKEKA